MFLTQRSPSRDSGNDPPETWDPPAPLRERIVRGMLVPARAGVVVVVLAVVIAIAMVWLRPHSPGVAEAVGGEATALEGTRASADSGAASGVQSDGDAGAAGAGSDAETVSGRVFVHVVGEVTRPGVVELSADARVEEAIEKAGGATEGAVLSAVNLARTVSDGEQIVVPDAEGAEQAVAAAPDSAAGGASGGSGGSVGADQTGTVNLNTADATALETLPRVGPALAQRILDWRQTNGRFQSVDQLLEVSGIGAKTLEGFRDQVTV